ncbi:MAG TPA: hypothetical protein VHN14_33425 [Kofleriaceae bacterium]|jgi:hypothetical protein|nr:hypothetical protein [Kofleriaceae bacterium]
MIHEIQELIRMLSTAPLGADEVARRIGSVIEDNGPTGGLRIRPSNQRLGAAIVFRDAATGAPTLVRLEPAVDQHLTVAALRDAFGPYQNLGASRFEEPAELLFRAEPRSTPYTAVVIARLDQPGVDPAIAGVASVTLRRDPRL